MRVVTVRQATDLKALTGQLLDRRISGARGETAIAQLQAANPHVDFTKLVAGTVLLVPDSASFKASASSSVPGGALDDFQKLVGDSLGQAAARLKTASAARANESAAVTAAVKTAAVKRLLDADADLAKRVEQETKALDQERKDALQAEKDVAAASKAILAICSDLAKTLG